jgi:hypothetical protein
MRICYTHFGVSLGIADGMTEKEITSLSCLAISALVFPTISAVHFLAFAFLAKT